MPFDFNFDDFDFFDFEKDPDIPEEYKSKKKKESSWLEDFLSYGSAESDMYVRPEPLPNPKPTAADRVPKLSAAGPETIWQKVAGTIDDFINPRTPGTMAPDEIADAQIRVEAKQYVDPKGKAIPLTKGQYQDVVDPENSGAREDSSLLRDIGSGAMGVVEGMAGAAEWITNGAIGGDLANQAKVSAQDIASGESGFWHGLAQGTGSMATFFIPSIGVMEGASVLAKVAPKAAQIMGAATMTAMESFAEAGSVYRQMMEKTRDPMQASSAAMETFTENLALLAITNKLGIFGNAKEAPLKLKAMLDKFKISPESFQTAAHAVLSSAMEGAQEMGQNLISSDAMREKVDWVDTLMQGAYGAILGGPVGIIAKKMTPMPIKPELSEGQKAAIDKANASLAVPDNDGGSILVKNLIEKGTIDDVKFALQPENQRLWTAEEKGHLEKHLVRLQATESPAAKMDKAVDDHLQGKVSADDLINAFANEFDDTENLLRDEPLPVEARKIRYGDKQPELDLGTSSMPLFDATNLSSPSEIVDSRANGEAVYSPTISNTSTINFADMVKEAARWKGAAINVDEALGEDKKARLAHSRITTKGDLDAYLMKKYGIDATVARSVSNELTDKNIPADRSAKAEDFADEPWAKTTGKDMDVSKVVTEEYEPYSRKNPGAGGNYTWKRVDKSKIGKIIKEVPELDYDDYTIDENAAYGQVHVTTLRPNDLRARKELGIDVNEKTKTAITDSFELAPDLRGKGLGRKLWQKIEDDARKHGAERFELWHVMSDAHEFWRKMGFKPIAGGSEDSRTWVKEKEDFLPKTKKTSVESPRGEYGDDEKVTRLVTKPLREAHKKLQEEIKDRLREKMEKVAAYDGWKWEIGDRVKSKKTGKVWEVTAKSWNDHKNVPTYYMRTRGVKDGEESGMFYAEPSHDAFIHLKGPISAVKEADAPYGEPAMADTFYSQMAQVLDKKLPNQGTPAQFRTMINAWAQKGEFKAEELKWSGVDEWLAGKKDRITKKDVVDFIKENQIQIKEITKDKPASYPGTNTTKYDSYQLPGGENYKELLLTLPERSIRAELDAEARKIAKIDGLDYDSLNEEDQRGYRRTAIMEYGSDHDAKVNYRSSHWSEPNVLLHVRMNDRIDADGKRVLFLEEVQSDWHQEGRQKGYKRGEGEKPKAAVLERNDGKGFIAYDPHMQTPRTFATREEAHQAAEALGWEPVDEVVRPNGSVPQAPFSKTWHELGMKRMLRYAAENGYDRLAWTTGEQQAERYDLSKQLDAIEYSQHPIGYWLRATDKNDHGVLAQSYSEEELPNVVGKELAEKIVSGVGVEVRPGKWGGVEKRLSGLDLKVGGEGMKGFYDKILPSFMNKYVKKWGAKVEEMAIPREESKSWKTIDTTTPEGIKQLESWGKTTVHSVDITPAMRKDVLTRGQTLYEPKADYEGGKKKAPSFYSNTASMLEQQNETAMPPAEWKKRIEAWGQKFAGIREENQWSGLLEYIDSRSDEKKIPKADLLEYMEETKKGWLQQENEPDDRWSSRNLPGGIPGTEQMWIYSKPGGTSGLKLHRDIMTEILTAGDLRDLDSLDDVAFLPLSDDVRDGTIKPGDWGHFDTDGGALLFVTPRRRAATREAAQQDFIDFLQEMEPDNPMLIPADADTYSSPHFPYKPNVLLHIRTQKMRDSEGRIGIVAETIQSDWHQEGRKTGYVENLAALNAQIAALRKEKEDFIHAHGKSSNYGGMTFLEVVAEAQTFDARIGELLERTRSGVPDAPFKDTWHEQGLKRLIDIAAKDPEVEWLGWTPGEAQAERWGKSQKRYIGKVEYTEVEPGKYSLVVQWKPPWTRTEDRDADKFRVQNAFGDLDKIKMEWGAEVADAIRNKEGLLDEATETQDERGIAELNRNVSAGGDYLKLLYDKKLPKFADKYVKKWGAKVEEKQVDATIIYSRFQTPETHTIHAITITPQMRKEIVEKGQAFYEPKASYADKAIEQLGRIVNLYNAKGISGLGLFDRSKQSADRNAAGVRGKETRHHTVGKLVDDLKALKPVRLRGAEVKGWDDVYEALRITRNKNVEILQVLYIGEESGKILYNEACSSRLPGAVQIASPEILAAGIRSTTMKMERLSQENVRVVLAHNHPSGDVTASDADIAMTKNMAKLINRYGIQFDGHIVINHNKYNAISGKGDAVKRSITDVPAEYAEDPLLTIPVPHEKLGETLSRQDHVAAIAKDINRGDKYFTILMRSGIKVRGIVNVELGILDDPQKATEYIKELMVNHGAQDSFVYCENFTRDQIETLVDLVKGNTLRDAAWEGERRTTSLLEQGIYPDSRKQFGKDMEDFQGEWLEDYQTELQEGKAPYREDEGRGWFYNRELDKLEEIDKGDLGPNGDHDGWISIGDNAEKMGVKDAHGARAFQAATYGIDTEQYPQFEKWAEGGYVFTQDDSIADDPKFQRTFKKVFGTDLDTARWTRFPELTRVRYYPAKDKHYPHGRAVMDIDRLDAATMTSLKKMVPKLKLHPDTVVIIYREDGPSIEIPKSEFANVRNAYDLKKYSVKVVRDKDAPYGEDLDEPPFGDEDDSFDFGNNVEKAIDKNPEEYISIDFIDHLDGYIGTLRSLVIEGEPGKRTTDKDTGEAIWWSSTYPEFMQDQGWSQKEVLSALSHSIKGEEMTEKQREIVQTAINQAVEMFYEDLNRWYPNMTGKQYDKAEASIRKATDAFLSRYYTNQKLLKQEKEKADRATMITKSKYQWEKEKRQAENKAWEKGAKAVHAVQDQIIEKLQTKLDTAVKIRDQYRDRALKMLSEGKQKNLDMEARENATLNEIKKLNSKVEKLKASIEKIKTAKPKEARKSIKAIIRISTGQNLDDKAWISKYKLLTEQIRREAMAARKAFSAGNREGLLAARTKYKMLQAQQRAMRDIRRETNKIVKDFKKVLKKTSEMTPEYANKIKSLLEDFDLSRMTGETRLKLEAIREALIENPDADIDERTLDTLKRLEKTPVRDISYPELKAMHDAVMHFATLGKRGPTMIMSQKAVMRDMVLKRSFKDMRPAKEVAKDLIPDATYSRMKSVRAQLAALRDQYGVHLDTYDNIVESLGGMQSMMYRVLYREIKRGSNERDRIAYELEDDFMAAQEAWQKRHPEIKDVLGWLSEEVEFARIRMNRNLALSLYRGWFDPDFQRSVIESGFGLWGSQDRDNPNKIFKVSGERYGDAVNKLSKAEREYADLAIPTINKSGDLLADKFLEINGYAMPRVEDIYWRKEVLASEREQDEQQEQLKERFGRPHIFKGMTKKRTGSSAAVWLKPYTVAVREMHKRAADYVGLEEAMNNAAWLMYNKEFKSEIEARYGLPVWREIEKGLKDIAEVTTPELSGNAAKFFRWLRNKSTVYALAANYGSMLKQLNGTINYMVYVDPGYIARAVRVYASNPMAVKRLHRQMSVEYRRRREMGYSQDIGNVLQVLNKQGLKPSAASKMGAVGLIPLQQFDIFGVDLGMLGATYQAMDAFKAGKMPDQMRMTLDITDAQVTKLTPAQKMELAYRWADFVTQRTQNQNVPEHMSGWQRGGELEKQLSMFFGEMQKNIAGFARAYRAVKRGDPGAKALLLKSVLIFAIIGMAVDAGVNELKNQLRGRRGDKWWAAVLKSYAGYLPGIRDVAGVVIDQIQGRYYSSGGDTPYERVRAALEKPLGAGIGAINANTPRKQRDQIMKFTDGLANFFSMLAGIPYHALKEPIRIWNREDELRKTRAEERRRRAI